MFRSLPLIILNLIIVNKMFSQSSELGRFTVNYIKGCIPFEVNIISENLDSTVDVIQYDFDFNTTNNVFNPNSGKSFTYTTPGKYIIAQAINQDGVEKIDLIEIEALKPSEIDISFLNCPGGFTEILLGDNNYDNYNLYVQNTFQQEIISGSNIIDYSNKLSINNLFEGYIVGSVGGNEINCSKYSFSIAPINAENNLIIDSVTLSNDRTSYLIKINPERSTNYEVFIDNKTDSIFITPSYLYFEHSNLELKNESFNERCISIFKNYGCDTESIEDKICLIYLNVTEIENGINVEFNSNGEFDSLLILKNGLKIQSINNNKNKFIDNNGILSSLEYCYQVIGFKDEKKSISNTFCVSPLNNYNPIPIPNAFTPNGDGLNDIFKPFPSDISDFKMFIFNKFGEKLFESNDINVGWDGYFKGKIMQDTYIYKIEFLKDGQIINVSDKFLLIK